MGNCCKKWTQLCTGITIHTDRLKGIDREQIRFCPECGLLLASVTDVNIDSASLAYMLTNHQRSMCDHMGWPNPEDPCPCGFNIGSITVDKKEWDK